MPKVVKKPGVTEVKKGVLLTAKQRKFVEAYVSNGYNGTNAALASYEIDTNKPGWRSTAESIASENLRKPEIIAGVNEYSGFGELTDDDVDREIAWMLIQREDAGMKRAGAEMYNKINGRYEKDNKQKAQVINFLEDRDYEPRSDNKTSV